MDYDLLDSAVKAVKDRWPEAHPLSGLVLGSGWGAVVEAFEIKGEIPYEEIAGLDSTGVAGHAGKLAWAELEGVQTFIFQGRRHWYEGVGWTPIALPIYLLKNFDAKIAVLSNAAGGIGPALEPGRLMIIEDHINLMGANPLQGPPHPAWGPRFPDLTEAYDRELRFNLKQAGDQVGVVLEQGVYAAMAGPSYETPAEIRMLNTLGASAAGMSTVPEAILARACGLRVLALSCITNLAAGISPDALSHEEVTDTANKVMDDLKRLLTEFWKSLKELQCEPA